MDRIKSVIQHSKGDKSPRSNSDIPRKTTDSHEPPIQRASTDPSEHSGGRSSSEEDRQHLENASLKRQERQQEREEKANQMREEIAKRHRKAWETDPVRANYGEVEPINVGENQPQDEDLPRERLDYIARKSVGTKIAIRARVHHVRPMSAKVAFIVLRQQLSTIQAVLVERDNAVSISMIQWAERLRPETVVIVEGVLQKPQAAKAGEVKSATFHHVEILVGKVPFLRLFNRTRLTCCVGTRHRLCYQSAAIPCLRRRETPRRLRNIDANGLDAVFRWPRTCQPG
jgi:hypothetical protein